MAKPITIAKFIAKHGLTMKATHLGKETTPGHDGHGGDTRDNWRVVISRVGLKGRLTTNYHCGSAWKGEAPKLDDVLDCLASDASMIENARNFADFASDLGIDADSRKEEKLYKRQIRARDQLKNFLTEPHYQTLLYKVERQ